MQKHRYWEAISKLLHCNINDFTSQYQWFCRREIKYIADTEMNFIYYTLIVKTLQKHAESRIYDLSMNRLQIRDSARILFFQYVSKTNDLLTLMLFRNTMVMKMNQVYYKNRILTYK